MSVGAVAFICLLLGLVSEVPLNLLCFAKSRQWWVFAYLFVLRVPAIEKYTFCANPPFKYGLLMAFLPTFGHLFIFLCRIRHPHFQMTALINFHRGRCPRVAGYWRTVVPCKSVLVYFGWFIVESSRFRVHVSVWMYWLCAHIAFRLVVIVKRLVTYCIDCTFPSSTHFNVPLAFFFVRLSSVLLFHGDFGKLLLFHTQSGLLLWAELRIISRIRWSLVSEFFDLRDILVESE